MEEDMQLGGNIVLSGFSSLDRDSLIVLKKIVGNYARKFSDTAKNFENLSITMKPVHERETSEKYEIHAKVIDGGKPVTSEVTDRNLFVTVDSALKKIESLIVD